MFFGLSCATFIADIKNGPLFPSFPRFLTETSFFEEFQNALEAIFI